MKKINKKYYLNILFLFSLIFTVRAQNSDKFWLKTNLQEKNKTKLIERKTIPTNFGLYQLNLNSLKRELSNAPKRKGKLTTSNNIVSFPNEKGEFLKYQVFESSIMEESLQKKHPNIKSYIGKGIDNSSAIIRFSITPLGLHGMIFQKTGETMFIDPYTTDKESYIVYTKKNLPSIKQFQCKFDELNSSTKLESQNVSAKTDNANDGNLRTYRLAIATTGEYSQFHITNQLATDDEKKTEVLAAINVTMTRVNGIFEKDVALTMVLVDNNTDVIFLDALTDELSNNDSSSLIDESQTVIDANIGTENYDIGHTFSTGGDGLAQLRSPCTSSKARGITGSGNPIGDSYDIDFVAHEMGHQFGAHHTFNSDSGGCGGNRDDSRAVEPGSGSTIMAYAGLCAPNNVQNNSSDYFHLVSIREMWANISNGNSQCGVITNTGNNPPTIDPLTNYTIPTSTPFILNANATDIDGDELTYTWEQLDTEIVPHPLVSTATGGPAFRSLSPTSSSKRYFPNQSTVITGDLSSTWEVLPSVGRTMAFGVTVRDNNLVGGQTASEETTITIDGTSGPFNLTSQTTNETWDAGTTQTITWDVANTNISPVNCLFVNILLSTDGGLTYPITLDSNVLNDGSHDIVAPNNATTNGRVKIESVENIFYTMNSADITIQTSEFIMNFVSNNKAICTPNNIVYTFTYNTFLGFNEETTFSALNNPTATTVTFNPTTATTDNTTVEMTISSIENEAVGNYSISVTGTSASTTKTTVVNLDVYSSMINPPVLISPENTAISILKPYALSWSNDANALNYDVQISIDNTFFTIVETATVNTNSYTPLLLGVNTNYFWRVKSKNNCGESGFSSIYNFTTANETCSSTTSTDTPLGIPDNNAIGVSSILNVTADKTITDVNVTVNITHTFIGDLTLTLISPKGTSIILVTDIGDDGNNFVNTIFDNDALSSINSGGSPFSGIFKPLGNLSQLNNEESLGDWKLKASDSEAQDIGQIENWSIEICGIDVFRDDDNDTIVNSLDLCPNTPTGETVNANGCSDSELNDDDNDTIINGLDLCPTTPTGETVDTNGCSDSQLDDDNDSIMNNVDDCPNTPLGIVVNSNGCPKFSLPSNNFTLKVTSETCPDKKNGKLEISTIETHNYEVSIVGNLGFNNSKNFTDTYLFENLIPDIYTVCITVTGETFEQCFVVEVINGTTVSGKTSVTSGKATVEIKDGTAPYHVFINDKELFQTNESLFHINVHHGDVINVKTAVSCEGTYSKTIELLQGIVAYPNPTNGTFEIALLVSQKEVTIELYTIHSQLISVKTYPIAYGRVQLNIENQPSGLYIAKVKLDKPITLKIIKQ